MNLKNLETEQRNPRTMHIDSMSTLDMVRTVNQEDAAVTQAVETALPDIARLIDGICERLQNGGSLYYIGRRHLRPAGSTGRFGMSAHLRSLAPVGSGHYRRRRFRAPRFQ